jgi:predicted transcriptional regulator
MGFLQCLAALQFFEQYRIQYVMITAEHIMNPQFVAVRSHVTVGKAIVQMLDEGATLVAVVDENGRITGTLPDSVILRAAVDAHLRHDPISLHIQRQFATISPLAPLDLVLEQFVLHDLQAVPVVDSGRMVGVIHRVDLLRGVMGADSNPENGRSDWLNNTVWL